jgi:hypothetical protein
MAITTTTAAAAKKSPTKRIVTAPTKTKQDAMLQVFGFKQSECSFCMKSIDELNGLLMQCGKCRDVYFCSKQVCIKINSAFTLFNLVCLITTVVQ